jgi:hypothetical protein
MVLVCPARIYNNCDTLQEISEQRSSMQIVRVGGTAR